MGIIGLVVRSGLVVGAVYYTRQAGVWGNSVQTEKLYNNIKAEVSPHVLRVKKELPFQVPALPQTGEIRYLTKHYYNQGVKGTFHFIQMLPCYAGQAVKKARDTFDEFAQPPPTAASAASVVSASNNK